MRLQNIVILTLASLSAFGQTAPYVAGTTFQKDNPNYPKRNPFYFEGAIDWNLLKIDTPNDTWEFAQRGIYRQSTLGDIQGAIADYQKSISLNNLDNGSCQIVTRDKIPANMADFGNLTPAPCMFTVRLRLANLLRASDPATAIKLLNEVLNIDPRRLGVHAMIAETYEEEAASASSEEDKHADLMEAVAAFKAELALSPVTELSIKLTGDEANNSNVHWSLAHVYEELGDEEEAMSEIDLYLKATKWHSDQYPWRIELARKKIAGAEAKRQMRSNTTQNQENRTKQSK